MSSDAPQTNHTLEAALTLLSAASLTIDDLAAYQAGASAVTVADYIATKVEPALSPGKRKVWRPYLAMLANGYPGLCACVCDRCLEAFSGDSSWQPCHCVEVGSCSCPPSGFDDSHPAAASCGDTFAGFGSMPLARVAVTDLERASQWARQRAYKRNLVRAQKRSDAGRPIQRHDGRSAAEHLRAAASAMYRYAIADDSVLGVNRNLALELTAVSRPPVVHRALTVEQLNELWEAIYTSGSNDVELDVLLVWTTLELGTRRSGPLNMLTGDLLHFSEQIRLSEKNKTVAQPASPGLILTLIDHALRRGGADLVVAVADGLSPEEVRPLDVVSGRARIRSDRPVFYYQPRYQPGSDGGTTMVVRPLGRKRFESLFGRLRANLAWFDAMHGRPHDLRKTAATFIERAFGHAVARGWLRHSVDDVTGIYVAPGADEVVSAHRWWTGSEPTEHAS
ncbi:MAG: hypothetical protein ACLFRV_05900 [Acidimicrobiales bacterium]